MPSPVPSDASPPVPFFPFSALREGQRDLIDGVSSALSSGESLLVHAPTGIGKTAAVLAPAIEFSRKEGKLLLFLAPRHSQHKLVIETLRMIEKSSGEKIRVLDMIGKKWLCSQPAAHALSSGDFQEYCRFLRKDSLCMFYKNMRDKKTLTPEAKKAIDAVSKKILHAEEARAVCKGVCAYEVMLEAARSAEVIIADYFHVFHPSIREAFLTRSGRGLEDCVLIVDEAHNLPDRMRSFLSSRITDRNLELASREAAKFGFKEVSQDLRIVGEEISTIMTGLFGYNPGARAERFVSESELVSAVESVKDYDRLVFELESLADAVRESQKKSFMGGVANFLGKWRERGDRSAPERASESILEDGTAIPATQVAQGFARIARVWRDERGGDHYELALECLDPRIATMPVLNSVHSSILMSGTLTPVEMYSRLLGMKDAKFMELLSPFPSENRLNLVISDVTTRYSRRGEDEYMRIAGKLVKIINNSGGNVLVFFPSYEVRDRVYEIIMRSLAKKTLLEKPGMTKEEKSALFSEFVSYAGDSQGGAALMCVMGASFSEGVDLPGEHVKVVVIVGIPLSVPDLKTRALIDHYEKEFGKGWNYGYVYPAINRVTQAAGRCIRSEKDRGVVVFLDERFLWENYRKVLPKDFKMKKSVDVAGEIREFFGTGS